MNKVILLTAALALSMPALGADEPLVYVNDKPVAMRLYIDHDTGCHYLSSKGSYGYLQPRMWRNPSTNEIEHMCGGQMIHNTLKEMRDAKED